MVWEGCGNLSFDCVYSIQTLFEAFVVKSQHWTECTFYSKQPLPRVFCALPPVLPTWCDKTVAIWMSWLCWFNPDSLRSYCHKHVNIQLSVRSTLSSLFLASSALFLQSCLHGVTKLRQSGCLGCVDSIQTLFEVFVMKKIEKVNIQLTLRSTLSSLFLASSALFLQSCLHGVPKLRQCGFLGCVDSIQTLFAVFVINKWTFHWLYVLL